MATTPRSKAETPAKASKETLEFVERMKRDPKIQHLIREGKAAERRGEGVRWEDLKRKHDGHWRRPLSASGILYEMLNAFTISVRGIGTVE